MGLLLGIDVGTSATKAVVIDRGGRILGVGSAEHPSSMPRAGWSEQDPRDWWWSSCEAVGRALGAAGRSGAEVVGVGLSGQMHGSVLLDQRTVESGGVSDEILRAAILWNDQRTGEQCRRIEELAGGRAELVRRVGNAALPGFTLPKWMWVREHEPEVWGRVARAMMPKDYVRFRMTGEVATDVGDAAGTLVFDVDARAWSRWAIEKFGVDERVLPGVVESGCVAGRVTRFGAEAMGLREGVPVAAGSGDNQCGAIGAGVVERGLVLATLGTSGMVYAHAAEAWRDVGGGDPPPRTSPRAEPQGDGGGHSLPLRAQMEVGRVHTMCAADGGGSVARGHWSITGCTLSAGGALAWARERVFGGAGYEELLREAAEAPAGCEGLVFLPYLTGERCPFPDPTASGAWIGLTARHGRGHLVRAVLEGVAVTMGQILGIMRSMGVEARACRLGGGGTRGALWREILTAALDVRTQVMETEEGPAMGAALLGGVGAGVWESVAEACRATIRVAGEVEPNPGLLERYREVSEVVGGCYADLRRRMECLARWR